MCKPIWKPALFLTLCCFMISIPAAGEEIGSLRPAGQAAVESAPVEPSAAFPGETCFYLELFRPVETVDRLSRMELWPEAVALIDQMTGLLQSEGDPSPDLAPILEEWGGESAFRRHLHHLAGESLAFGLVPGSSADRLVPVVAVKGSGEGDQAASLAAILGCFRDAVLQRPETERERGGFSIRAAGGKVLFQGRELGDWLVMAPPAGKSAMDRVAGALSGRVDALPESLSANPDFRHVMASLPASPSGRGYLNCGEAARWLDSSAFLSDSGKDLARLCLAWTSSIGIARDVGEDGIKTWMTGKILEDRVNAAVPGLIGSLAPIADPLSARFPRTALLTYEAGVPLDRLLDTVGFFVKELAPWLDRKMEGLAENFVEATDLDPAVDLHPYLGRSVAAACLPADLAQTEWPFPRSVMLVRVKDRKKVKAFISTFVRWDASVWAPLTGGLISAMTVSDRHEGVDLMGVELDSLINVPLPSPTFALMDDLLIASSVRSGVKEVISTIRGRDRALTQETITESGPVLNGAVELVHMNLPVWAREWERYREIAVPACCLIFLDRDFLAAHQLDERRVDRLCRGLFGLLSRFGRATGSTRIDSDGMFTFFVEVRLP